MSFFALFDEMTKDAPAPRYESRINVTPLDHFERTSLSLGIVDSVHSGKFIGTISKFCPLRIRTARIGHMALHPDGKKGIRADVYASLKLMPGKNGAAHTEYTLDYLEIRCKDNEEWLVTKLFTALAKAGHIVKGWNDVTTSHTDSLVYGNKPQNADDPDRLFQ